jgi:predicted molibdopterin-dependent oxidoreductase YjgC
LADPIYGDLAKLIEISIQGKKFKVPENNTCLRAFQYLSPESVSYGRFCWNQECQTCRVAYKMGDEPNSTPRSVLACKTLVAEGMVITELSEELTWVLLEVLKPSQPRPPLE